MQFNTLYFLNIRLHLSTSVHAVRNDSEWPKVPQCQKMLADQTP